MIIHCVVVGSCHPFQRSVQMKQLKHVYETGEYNVRYEFFMLHLYLGGTTISGDLVHQVVVGSIHCWGIIKSSRSTQPSIPLG